MSDEWLQSIRNHNKTLCLIDFFPSKFIHKADAKDVMIFSMHGRVNIEKYFAYLIYINRNADGFDFHAPHAIRIYINTYIFSSVGNALKMKKKLGFLSSKMEL